MPLLGVDVGSARMHVAIAHEGHALPVPAGDGLPFFPSAVGCTRGQTLVGAAAHEHFFTSPEEVVFDPVRYLGKDPVRLGADSYAAEDVLARLLEQAAVAGADLVGAPIEGMALSRPAATSREARQALAIAVQGAGLNLLRTEVATTLAAVARHSDRGPLGLAAFVDVGAQKIEATIAALEIGSVRALGRGVNQSFGASWLDQRLVKVLAHQVAPAAEERLLGDRLCHAMLCEQCEALRAQLGTDGSVMVALPFLMPFLGVCEPPVWKLDRHVLETLAWPLLQAIPAVCREALANAQLDVGQIGEVFLLGGLAHMPAVRDAVTSFFGRLAAGRGDSDGLVARGAALAAAASLGQLGLKVVDELDERGRPMTGAPTPPPASRRPPVRATPTSQEWQRAPTNPRAEPLPPHGRTPSQEWLRTPTSGRVEANVPPARTLSQDWLRAPSEAKPAPVVPPAASEPARQDGTSPPRDAAEATPTTPSPRGTDSSLPSEGSLRNPRDPAALAATPFDGTLPPGQPLSVPVLLLALGRRRSFSGQLRLKHDGHEACIAIVRGGAAGSAVDLEQLRRSFEWPEGTYRLSGEAPAPRLVPLRQSMVSVVMHGIRSCLRAMDLQQVLDILAPHLAEAPAMLPNRTSLVPSLGLSPRELRFVEHVLDGANSVEEILRRGGIGRETAVHILFMLQLFRALEWRAAVARPGESPTEQLRLRARKLERADHFDVLGVHWSVSRAELDRALHQIEDEMRPDGPASRLDAEAAALILARARQAHHAVAAPQDRRAYLLEIHPDLDFDAIESVAEEQNHLYSWRGANEATRETARLKDELTQLSRLQHEGGKPSR